MQYLFVGAIVLWSGALIGLHLWLLLRQQRLMTRPAVIPDDSPRVMVVLPLRGSDPFLQDALTRLARLDYPDYHVQVVVDSADDPARHVVQQFLDESHTDVVSLSILRERRRTCASKISSLLQATEVMPDDCDVVLLVDGDSLLHESSLREMVGPFRDPAVWVTSGQRWYAPREVSLTAMIRAVWNAFAVHAMSAAGIPWGGCLAVRAGILRTPELRSQLAHAFADDCAIGSFVHACQGKVVHVAQTTLINREDVSWQGLFNFVVRQMLCPRVQNTRWPLMAGYCIVFNVTSILLLIAAPLPSSLQVPIAICGLGLLAVTITLVLGGDLACRRQALARHEAWPPTRLGHVLLWPVAFLAANTLSLVATLVAMVLKEHTWRGITYRFGNPPVEIVRVVPVQPATPPIRLQEVVLASVE